MKMAIEIFCVIIVVTLSSILFSSIISSENQNTKARDFYNVCINRIEDSNCNLEVIEQCQKEADQEGYTLEAMDVTMYQENPSFFVTLKYVINFPIYKMLKNGEGKEAVIEGYAR